MLPFWDLAACSYSACVWLPFPAPPRYLQPSGTLPPPLPPYYITPLPPPGTVGVLAITTSMEGLFNKCGLGRGVHLGFWDVDGSPVGWDILQPRCRFVIHAGLRGWFIPLPVRSMPAYRLPRL